MFTRNKIEMLLLTIFLLFFCISKAQAGEPVPGAEITIELEPDDEPIANVTTDPNGEFEIVFSNTSNNLPNIANLPSLGTFVFTIKPSKSFALKHKFDLQGSKKIKVKFKKENGKRLKNGIVFRYVLTWKSDAKAENKGTFAVSGKSDA
ncbi:MAG: carboxypeptidase regulatory-like domain-containing protein [Ignavibacteria bacterium]|nr:carboxypeptidase regulatory-like domain-containing protein [Ignavibacteria bacterium]